MSSYFALRFNIQPIVFEIPLCVATSFDEVMFGEYIYVYYEVEV